MPAQVQVYTVNVSYNANGGSGGGLSPSSASEAQSGPGAVSVSVPLRTPSWTRYGYHLKGWGTSANSGVAYAFGSTLTHTFSYNGSNQTYNVTLYAVWGLNQYYVNYNANGGSGAPSRQSKYHGYNLTLSSTVPTRTGYQFLGWATSASGSVVYQPGGTYSANSSVTLYAKWKKVTSDITIPSGQNVGASINIKVTANTTGTTNTLTYTCGSASGTIASNVSGASSSGGYVNVPWTVPESLASQAPSAKYVSVTVTCVTYVSGSNVGSTTATQTFNIPNSAPFATTVSLASEIVNSISMVEQWGIAVSTKSAVKLTASASPKYGASVASYAFSGTEVSAVYNTSATSKAHTSGIIQASGTLTYTVRVTDSRGYSNSVSVNVTFYPYSAPAISSVNVFRANGSGTADPVTGEKLSATVDFDVASCNGHNNSHANIYYKRDVDSSYTLWISNAIDAQTYLSSFAIAIANGYDVKITVTDDFGDSTVTYVTQVGSVIGVGMGLLNDRMRLGGPCRIPGFECDWDAQFDGVVDIVNRRSYATLSSAGWYRVCKFDFSTYGEAIGASGGILHLNITDSYGTNANDSHTIDLLFAHNKITFANESSVGNHLGVDKIRYTFNSASPYDGFVDIHWVGGSSYIGVTFDYDSIALIRQANLTSSNLIAVASAPSGETVLAMHSFTDNNTHRYLAKSYTTNSYVDSTAFNRIYAYQHGDMVQITFNLNFTSAMPTTSNFVEIGRFTLPTNRGFPFSILQTLAGQKSSTNILVQISTSGVISIYNEFSTSASGWYRATITAELIPTELI